MNTANRTILVTGGAGYIGSHVCKALKMAGYQPVVLDNLSNGHRHFVQWGPLIEADIRDAAALKQIIAEVKPRAIMHFAAQISVAHSVSNPADTYEINTMGAFNLLEAMRAAEVKTIVFSSTAAVYGIPEVAPIPEDAPKNPINPYGQSKLMVEKMLADYRHAYGFAYAALRYFNAAGADLENQLGYLNRQKTHLIPLVMDAITGQTPPLKVMGTDYPTPDGTAVRDYVHVADLAMAHLKALEYLLEGGEPRAFNLGTNQGYSVKQVLENAQTVTGHAVPAEYAPRRVGDPAILVADATAARKILNWQPQYSDLATIIRTNWAWQQKVLAEKLA